ncbi:hypothetical protein C7M84_014078 [Penaeus vannamei]|uniref:Uncharacterized protein n=1 Tax=Penaeus vannamei TaxID=6689 RepID=A0A423SUD3_PENVA|nr:hypothetical protein C7M84_014078 [Penaeus vannamei]
MTNVWRDFRPRSTRVLKLMRERACWSDTTLGKVRFEGNWGATGGQVFPIGEVISSAETFRVSLMGKKHWGKRKVLDSCLVEGFELCEGTMIYLHGEDSEFLECYVYLSELTSSAFRMSEFPESELLISEVPESDSEEFPESETSEEFPESETSEEFTKSETSEEFTKSETSEEFTKSETSEEFTKSETSEEFTKSETSDQNSRRPRLQKNSRSPTSRIPRRPRSPLRPRPGTSPREAAKPLSALVLAIPPFSSASSITHSGDEPLLPQPALLGDVALVVKLELSGHSVRGAPSAPPGDPSQRGESGREIERYKEAPEDLFKQDLLPAHDPVLLRGIPRGEDAPPATSMPLHGAPFPCDFVRVLPLAVGLRGEIDDPQQVLERLDIPKAPCRSPWPRPTSGWGAASAGPGEDCPHPAISSVSRGRIGFSSS